MACLRFSVALLLLLLASCAAAAPMPLQYMASTVSGQLGIIGSANGPPGVSTLRQPVAICKGFSEDELLIGSHGYFRRYSRSTQMTETLIGDGTALQQDGPWEDAKVRLPTSCVRLTLGNKKMIVYFVENQNYLRYMTTEQVYTMILPDNLSFTDIEVHGNTLYLTEQTRNNVWTCLIDADGTPQSCKKNVGFECEFNKFNSVAITSQRVFVAGNNPVKMGICLFDLQGTKIATHPGPYKYIFHLVTSDLLYAMSDTQLAHMSVENDAITITPFAGDTSNACPPMENGYDFTLCFNMYLFVHSENEMYISTKKDTVRSITLPPAVVENLLPPPPLPLGFPDEDKILPEIISLMNTLFNNQLQTKDTYVDKKHMAVNEFPWSSNFSVMVQQVNFDNLTTPDEVLRTNLFAVTDRLEVYYNLTDEIIYLDTSIMPYCNITRLDTVQQEIVQVARNALEFPLIYSKPPKSMIINEVHNITAIKLLMPAPFNNDTTRTRLAEANFSEALLTILRDVYGPKNVVPLQFPFPQFDFSDITPENMMRVRWFIQNMVNERLEECQRIAGGNGGTGGTGGTGNGGDGNDNGDGSTCVATITNRTEYVLQHPPFTLYSEYEVFVPHDYNFDLSRCLNDTNWDPLIDLLGNYTEVHIKKEKCNRGCIIGIAVVAAVVLAALIALVVVLKSKRKRLAAVVAPAQPKFKGTLDDDEELTSSNPLDGNYDEYGRERY